MTQQTTEIAIPTVFKPLLTQLREIKKDNDSVVFDYESSKGEKEARSHVATIRKSKSAVNELHRDAKADILEKGKTLDAGKRYLIGELDTMIEKHMEPLNAKAARKAEEQRKKDEEAQRKAMEEQNRIDAERRKLEEEQAAFRRQQEEAERDRQAQIRSDEQAAERVAAEKARRIASENAAKEADQRAAKAAEEAAAATKAAQERAEAAEARAKAAEEQNQIRQVPGDKS